MESVAADLGRVCAANSGELKYEPRGGIDEPKAERDTKLLQSNRLYGRFSCTSDTAPFEVDVQAGNVVTERQIPPEVSWTLVLATATPDLIFKLRDRQRLNSEAAQAFRRTLKPGTLVAVNGSEVSAEFLGPDFKKMEGRLRGRKYLVCGLIVDVKDSLVQIQVGGGLLYVAPGAVYPAKAIVPLGYPLPPDDWENWCLKT